MGLAVLDITQEQIDAIYASDDTELQELLFRALSHPYYTFQSRPNLPAEYDEQSAFVERNYSVVKRENGLYKYQYKEPINFKVCLGGTGSGKTHAAAFKVASHVLEMRPPRPRTPFWVIGETFPQVCQAGWVEKLSHLIPEEIISDVAWYQIRRRWPFAVMLKHPDDPNEVGWVLEFKSYEQGIGAMKAVSIGGFWLNEECPYHLVGEIQGRCRDYDSPGWADFTPIECRDPEWPEAYENPPEGWKFYHLNSLKNTALAEGFIERYLSGVPEDMRELRTIGKFTALHGTVFQEFRKSTHVIEPFRIPRDWKKVRGIDFGYNNPFCCMWAAIDPDGRWYLYDEHYEAQRLLAYHYGKIEKREWNDAMPWFGRTYTDHDAQSRAELGKLGISCTLANKAINPSIEFIRSLMMVQGDGKPKFYIFNTCENLIREILGWKWPDGSLHRNPADTPEDKDNHCLVAGTMITCERGQVPIEEVTTDDRVLTTQGWKSVEWSGPTRFEETVLVTLEDLNGKPVLLEGTDDHPVWARRFSEGKPSKCEWIKIGDLNVGDDAMLLAKATGQGGMACVQMLFWKIKVIQKTSIRKQTFDLTIADAHEFFANGILVHNSIDAMRYALYTEYTSSISGKPEHRRVNRDTGRHGVHFQRAVR